MLTTELSELASVVARMRAQAHPGLDEAFVSAVLQAEADAAGNDSAALQSIRRALAETLGAQSV
jgi:hypothetical protein